MIGPRTSRGPDPADREANAGVRHPVDRGHQLNLANPVDRGNPIERGPAALADAFHVAVRPVRDRRTDRRGRTILAFGGVVLACLVAALAWWPNGSPATGVAANPVQASRSPATLGGEIPAPIDPTARASEAPRVSPGAAEPTPTEGSTTLPDLSAGPLRGAPVVTMWRPRGADAEILTWRSGDPALQVVTRIPGALSGFVDAPVSGTVSPNGRLLLVQLYRPADPADDLLRLFRISDGRLLWHADSLGPFVATLWRPGGNGLALGAIPTWVFIDIARDGVVSRRTVRTPVERILGPRLTDRVLPAAFSADGRWVYGARGGSSAPEDPPVVRVSWATGRAETIDGYPPTTAAIAAGDRTIHGFGRLPL